MTDISSSVATDDCVELVPGLSEPALLRLLWRESRWPALALVGGFAVWAVWIYSGLPMICH
ncbi:hypothetical protein ASE04_29640 [Rhizobium sp. Root708]|uniref:hypothetical protein n=1 Tax=Rhizobium sp. Root708 TaxID=1736592 RepID=UPI0006FEE713|nr:hypothetical protein [Rhizobium sp. Root708]KRB53370.1 hypothetical protein ASE04_29640 [Rhizobium sp. Root708]